MMLTFLILALVYVGVLLLKAWLAVAFAYTLPSPQQSALSDRAMTLVQAILSGDPLLPTRLEANLSALPGQDFLWLIDDEDAEGHRIAATLKAAHPSARLRIESCPPCPDATNPKLWKLRRAATLVETPLFCVLDDDTTLSAASALALADAAERHTVVTGLPCYLSTGDSPSGLLSQFVNNNSVFTYLGTSRLLPPFTLNGMGYVLRREELDRIKNFEPILHELTDDLALATLVLSQGGSIQQSKSPLQVQTEVRHFSQYMQLMHRWYVFTLLLLKRQSIPVQLLIFVLHGLPPILFFVMLLLTVLSANTLVWLVMVSVWILRWKVIAAMHQRFFGIPLHQPLLSLLSEWLQPVHLVHALCYRTIRWRTRRYKVRDTHDFSEV